MLPTILKRVALGLVLLFAVSCLIFFGMDALPGDFAATYLGQAATPQAVANLRAELGLEQPVLTRYVQWLTAAMHGDFGTSWSTKQAVADQLWRRLGNSLFLAGFAAAIAIPLAIGFGMLSVLYRNRAPDRLISMISLAAISFPEFFVGYLLILFFAVQFGVATFPATIYDGMSIWEKMQAVLLPAATLVLAVFAHIMRMTRAAILAIMSSAYMETAELKGVARSAPSSAMRRPMPMPRSSMS